MAPSFVNHLYGDVFSIETSENNHFVTQFTYTYKLNYFNDLIDGSIKTYLSIHIFVNVKLIVLRRNDDKGVALPKI